MRTYTEPKGICLFCETHLRNDNKILVCRKHRSKSPVRQKIVKQYYYKNKKEINKKNNEYAKLHREEKRIYDKKYSKKNRIKKRPYYAKYKRERLNADILYKLKCYLRKRIWDAFKRTYKSKTTEDLLGAKIKIVKIHIEKQFTKEMSWKNYGKWHVDHIIPLASAKTKKELEKLCHYKNLQPLWAKDNLKKSDKIL